MFKINSQRRRSGVFIVNFEHFSYLFLVFPKIAEFEQINVRYRNKTLT